MELGRCHEINVGLDETCRLSLANPRRCRGDDCLCARDVHDLEEEPCAKKMIKIVFLIRKRSDIQALDNPLHHSQVVHHLDERNEEDDGRELIHSHERLFRLT